MNIYFIYMINSKIRFYLHLFFDENRKIWSFQTISHPDFVQLAQIFVLDCHGVVCKKHIKPYLVEHHLTAHALAYWIMDNGGRSSYSKDYERKGFSLNTHSFPKNQVEMLIQGLQKRYGLDCWLKMNKNKWIIVISGYDHKKIMELIKPYIIPSMYHKIPGVNELMT